VHARRGGSTRDRAGSFFAQRDEALMEPNAELGLQTAKTLAKVRVSGDRAKSLKGK